MATINDQGNILAACPGCEGALASYLWASSGGSPFGVIEHAKTVQRGHSYRAQILRVEFRLFRCAGCSRGAIGTVALDGAYPGTYRELLDFHRESATSVKIPKAVPKAIETEFREAESCLNAKCVRASAGMFRSVLDKTLRANGYKVKQGTTLEQQIDMAAKDGVITQARRQKAHDEIRVLGNDVLHEEWREIPAEDVRAAHHYVQRVLEDFYDDRPSVLKLLAAAQRETDEDRAVAAKEAAP
jgi:hypothetical protein